MGMRAAVLVAVLCSEFVLADVYMHNPRGNNNRLKENAGNTNNQQRLFDSQVRRRPTPLAFNGLFVDPLSSLLQNNAKGGYGLGDDTDGSNKPMYFWTAKFALAGEA